MNEEKKCYKESFLRRRSKKIILSIVIPTFNSSKLLLRCLEGLEKQTVPKSKFEVTVANDGSGDDTIEMLSQFRTHTDLNLQWITILNSGPGIARNAGVEVSSGLWIGFLDADVIPNPNWVETATKMIQQKPFAGAFEGRTEVNLRNLSTPFTHQTENLDGGRYPTCNFIVRRKLAYFHPAYKIPFREDSDLAFSILASGFKIIFAPEMIVEHPPLSPSYSRPLALARRYYYDGLLARRFPYQYRHELDAHHVLGFKIPHLKRKLYSFFAISQIFLMSVMLFDFGWKYFHMLVFFYLVGFTTSSIVNLRYTRFQNLTFQDWFVFFVQMNVIPWVMGFSLFRGWRDFREESEFSV